MSDQADATNALLREKGVLPPIVPASADAWQRIQKIRLEHWVLF